MPIRHATNQVLCPQNKSRQILSSLKRQRRDFSEKEEVNAKRFDVRYEKFI